MSRTFLHALFVLLALAPAARAQAPSPQEVLGQDRLITLSEAVALALENNLGLQVERLDPAIARENVREAWGVFEPNLVAGYDRQHLETPVASAVQTFFAGALTDNTTEDYYVYDAGLQGILPWGFSYQSGYLMQQLRSNSSFFALDPQYTSTWRTELGIPLLRNLYWSAPDLIVRKSQIFKGISDESFRARLSDTVALVEASYWELAATRALEGAAQQSVKTAQDLLDQTKVQYEVGVVSKVRVTEAEAGLAQREFDRIVRTNAAEAAQDRLLTAILAPRIGDYTSTRIRTEEPTFVPYEVDAEAALERAKAQRPELMRAQLEVDNAGYDEDYAWNQKLPELNVIASYANSGLSGEQKIPPGTPQGFRDDPSTPGVFDPIPIIQPTLPFPTNRWGADNDFMSGDGEHSWGIRAGLLVPIGNDSADARYVKSKINLRRAKTRLRIEEQNVIVDVRSSVRDLKSAIDGVKASQRARAASEETLRAEQERLRLGDSTPHTVLEFDEDLRLAESNEIRALQVYRTAIAALERAQGTLLEKLGIDVIEERERGVGEF
ncbi:MAG: TolC family protein [Myxococcota bacterium]